MKKEVVRKKARSIFAILIWMLVVVMCFLSLSGCVVTDKQRHRYAIKNIQVSSGIEVPTKSEILFYYSDDSFHNGRHEVFAVFEFEEEPTDWLEENAFLNSNGDNGTLTIENVNHFLNYFKRGYFQDFFESGAEILPNEFNPNFDTDYLWKTIQNVYFFYYYDTVRLVVYIPWI